ncbi:VOC family protein [Marinomonas atlantica]|uniref:VOC family protein n=1 Tax=Marinomonas atlantica TaxID=1806668 RepID=UPI0008321DA0|nr:VOC family protein [Marinomonas atlantica]MCO4787160.1 VOC family protein [Marinomonas atlantica]
MIRRFDSVVLTVADIDQSLAFYQTVLGLKLLSGEQGRGVLLGEEKLVFQSIGQEMRHHALEGAAHFSLLSDLTAEQLILHFEELDIELLEGPIDRGSFVLFTFNDPDNNLIHIFSSEAESN